MKNAYMDMLAAYGVTAAHPGGKFFSKHLFTKHPLKGNNNVLEIGCGLGDTAVRLVKEFNANVTAIDPHPKMIAKAKVRHQNQANVNWVTGDVESAVLNKHYYDVVLAESVISFTNVEKTLTIIHDLLNNNGVLYLLEPIYLGGMSSEELEQYKTFYGFSSLLTEEEWENVLSNSGFSVKDIVHSYDVTTEGETFEFPDLILDESLHDEHVETFKKHEQFTENFLGYFDYAYFICEKNKES